MARPHYSVFDLWHLLSLDAPSVAALWCWTLARAADLHVPWTSPLMLGMGTWLLYVADRLLDGLLAQDRAVLRERHRFHLRHRRAFVVAGCGATLALVWLVPTHMLPNAGRENVVLGLCALVYLAVVHVRVPRLTRWFPKELAVGAVFAIATAVPAWARLHADAAARLRLLPIVVLFAALCWLNCVAIEAWESSSPSVREDAPASAATRWLGRRLLPFSLAIVFAALAFSVFGLLHSAASAAWLAAAAALAISALLLGLLDRMRSRFSPLHLRVAADAALLTPLLFLPWLRA